MSAIQAELWNRITSDLGILGVYEKCITPRMSEMEQLYGEMCDKFSATLTTEQQRAFANISDLAQSIGFDEQEAGVAMGLCIAKEVQEFLANPTQALHHASKQYTPVADASKYATRPLNEYFSNISKGGAV